MESLSVCLCGVLELLIVLFQVFGVGALCLCRLFPGSRWSGQARLGVVVALVGLAVAGAVCGRHDSEFALFAGGTITVLLIGMTVGGASLEMTAPPGLVARGDAPVPA
jgi:hypothetical protein